ncbi:MAG: nitrate- and nitrite sensing domain-containing protein, partial [Alphaproteobacteria bacterium]|nr:nitrate- and nitrite sensing domain-containing protein [Alphaproteobacteria bacterium]
MLANLRIVTRLIIAVSVPVAVLIGFTGYNLSDRWQTRAEMASLGALADGVARISRLVHDLQRERGASAVFVGSKGEQLKAELPAQRKQTDEQRAPALEFLKALKAGADAATLKDAIAAAESATAALDTRRQEIDSFTITPVNSNTYFTETVGKLLVVAGEIAKVSSRGDVTGAISAYVSFMQGKERAGQERATGAAGISTGKFDQAGYVRVLGLAAAQDTYLAAFLAGATSSQRKFYADTMAGRVTDEVLRMRKIVAEGGLNGELQGLDGKSWFDATTARIDLLKTVEDRIATDLGAQSHAILADATRALAVLAGIASLGLAGSAALILVMARSITGPVAAMTAAMGRLAQKDWTTEVPAQNRGDEIGQMAKAVQVFKENGIENERLQKETEEARKRQEQQEIEKRRLADEAAAETERKLKELEERMRRTAEEQKQAEERQRAESAKQRKAEMHALADGFEATVKGVVQTVSSSASEMQSSSTSMSAT